MLQILAWALPEPVKRNTVLAAVKRLERAANPEKAEAPLRRVQRCIKSGFINLSDAELVSTVCAALRNSYARGTKDPSEPVESKRPFCFVVSYPRSGSTLVLDAIRRYGGTEWLEAFDGLVQFDKRLYPYAYPLRRVVKDHVLRHEYDRDRTAIVMRDGRDTVISLAYMSGAYGEHPFCGRDEIADFIRFTQNSYGFGSWAASAAKVVGRRGQPHCLVEKYEDVIVNSGALRRIFEFVFDGEPVDHRRVDRLHRTAERTIEWLKSKNSNNSWGYGEHFPTDSMFYEWSQSRMGSSWRQSWDAAAKKAFHETGATDYLVEFGYETDADWWRQ